MSDEIGFLIYLYQVVKISQETIGNVIKMIGKQEEINEELYDYFKHQIESYKKISNSIRGMLKTRKKDIRDISIISKMATYMSVKSSMDKCKDIDEFCRVLIQGSKIAIVQLKDKLEDYNIKNKNIINLTNRLINIEQNNVDYLKKYVNFPDEV